MRYNPIMSSPSLEKIEQFRRQLKSDWTRDDTVSAWRKWHKQIAEFTRGATDAVLAEANLQQGQHVLGNIEFKEAAADSLPFPDGAFDVVTCRFGAMFFPDLHKALAECRRVLKPGGKVIFLVWGTRDQPFTTTTVGVLLNFVKPPEPDPDAPSMFMFGVRGRFESALKDAGYSSVKEDHLSVAARWPGSVEEFWTQFTEVAA